MRRQPFIQDTDFTLWQGDALEVLREMLAGSLDCCVTSPPYWGLRDYGHEGQLGLESTPDEYVQHLVAVFAEIRRCLTDAGTLWLNLGDTYVANAANNQVPQTKSHIGSGLAGPNRNGQTGLAPKNLVGIPWRVAFALQQDGWYLRSDIIWSKPNPMPESVTDRPTKAHEYVFLLSKSPRYWFDQEAVREPWADARMGASGAHLGTPEAYAAQAGRGGDQGLARFNARGLTGGAYAPPGQSPHGNARGPDGRHRTHVEGSNGSIQHRDGERWPNGGRNIRSVWEIATQPYPDAHFAVFPEELARRCILAGCPQGGTVLDPFGGSGTTALVARKHNRRSILIELSLDYCRLVAQRLQQLSLLSA